MVLAALLLLYAFAYGGTKPFRALGSIKENQSTLSQSKAYNPIIGKFSKQKDSKGSEFRMKPVGYHTASVKAKVNKVLISLEHCMFYQTLS